MSDKIELKKLQYQLLDSIAKFAIVVGAMWFNASNFDKTEVSAILMIILGTGGVNLFKHVRGKSDDES